MRMIYVMILFLIGIFETYGCVWMMETFAEKKISSSKYFVIVTTICILAGAYRTLYGTMGYWTWLLTLAVVFAISLSSFILFQNHHRILFVFTLNYYFCGHVLNLIFFLLFRRIFQLADFGGYVDEEHGCAYVCLFLFIRVVIYFCVYFLKKHATHNFLVYTEDLIAHFLNDVLIVTEIAGAFIFTVTFVYGTVGRHYVAWILYLCCVVLLMAFICLYLMLGRQQKRMRATDQRLEILNHSYRETVRLYRERDKIYHDLKNHILVMDGLLASGQTGKLAAYFHEIEQPIIGSSRLINTGNEIIDLVMNYKMSVARMKNIDFHFAVQGNCKNKLRLPDGEVCALFANVTDNAIEACEIQKTLQRKISMHIKAEKQMFFVEIRNTYDNEHTEKKPEALHKNIQYGGPHGIGMQNVREIVEKYQGHCECIKDNQLFCVRIMFF